MDNILVPAPRLLYKDLKESDYLDIFNQPNLNSYLKGGALTDIKLFRNNKYSNLFKKEEISGAGFWSILNNLARKSLPILKKLILPEALNLGSSIIEKVKSNPDSTIKKEELKNLAKSSAKNLAKKTLSSIAGKHRTSLRRKRCSKQKKHVKQLKKNKFRSHKKIKGIKSKRRVKRLNKFKRNTIFGNI